MNYINTNILFTSQIYQSFEKNQIKKMFDNLFFATQVIK